mgnify:CR=1 FL=1
MARLLRLLLPTFRFWFETEPHVYAISISAFALLSFFPFLIVMVSSFVYVLKWTAAVDAVFLALRDYFPDELGTFVRLNLMATVWQRGPAQFVSLILLLLTANGIFMPLEVALNKLWRVPANRSYLKNQLISIALIFLSGGAAVLSILLTAANQQFIRDLDETQDGDENSSALVKAIIALGHCLKLQVLAEGVETHQQLEKLRELGCDFAQGYLFARPQPAHTVWNNLYNIPLN